MTDAPPPKTFAPSLMRGLAPIAVTVGVGLLILALSSVSATLMAVQMLALALGIGLALGLSRPMGWGQMLEGMAWLGVVLLAVTAIWGAEIDGVRRWLALGPVRVHVAAIVLPLILGSCAYMLHQNQVLRALGPPLTALVALFLQPDASFVTALAFGTVFAVDAAPEKYRWRWPLVIVLMTVSAFAWHWDIPLAPVAHTEDIILLAEAQHTALAVVGLIALATAVLAPIVALGTPKEGPARSAALTLTGAFGALAVIPLLEPFPVPLLGYGASPILGMCIGVGLVVGMDADSSTQKPSEDA